MIPAHPVDDRVTPVRLVTLGLQHVLVMYGGAVAVPLIVGRALGLTPEQVALLISADLFCCGLVTIVQSFGVTRYFGVRLPVMMGVTFAAVGPMVAIAHVTGGTDGARAIFGALIGAGILSMALAPVGHGAGSGAATERIEQLGESPRGHIAAAGQAVRARPAIGQVVGAEQQVPDRRVDGEVLVHRVTIRAVVPVVGAEQKRRDQRHVDDRSHVTERVERP